MNSLPFQTLARPVTLQGVGLHSGKTVDVTLKPSSRVGVRFWRTDGSNALVSADYTRINSTFHATMLAQDAAEVSTPEHLLAALWGIGITHCDAEINGPEVPILDGSAAPWCDAISRAGIALLDGTRPLLSVTKPVRVEEENSLMLAVPCEGLRLTVAADFALAYLEPQLLDVTFPPTHFVRDIAAARTFALEKWIEPLREKGLIRGGSHDNALVLGETAPLSPLRYPDELARHKALDALGDLMLLTASTGAVLQGHFICIRAGHGVHNQWMQAAVRQDALRESRVT